MAVEGFVTTAMNPDTSRGSVPKDETAAVAVEASVVAVAEGVAAAVAEEEEAAFATTVSNRDIL